MHLLVSHDQILGRGFHDASLHKKFDEEISKMTTHWCCRSPKDQERFNSTDLSVLRILPVDRDPTAKIFRAVFGIEPWQGGYNNTIYV